MNTSLFRSDRFRVAVLLLVPLLTIAFLAPAQAERPGNRDRRERSNSQRRAPQQTQRQAPRPQQRQVARPQRQERRQQVAQPQRQQRRQVAQPQRQERRLQVAQPRQRQERRQQVAQPEQRRQRVSQPQQRQERRQRVAQPEQRKERREVTRRSQRQEQPQASHQPQRQERGQQMRRPQNNDKPQADRWRGNDRNRSNDRTGNNNRDRGKDRTRGNDGNPGNDDRTKFTRRPQKNNDPKRGRNYDNKPPDKDYARNGRRLDKKPNGRDYARDGRRSGRDEVTWTRPGRVEKTRPAPQVVRQPVSTNVRRDVNVNNNRNVNVNTNQNVNVNRNYNYNQNVVVSQPASYTYAAPNVCPPAYSVVHNYNPYVYSDYCERRAYRRSFFNRCSWPLLTLGFFISRPYSSYDYARVDYNNQPYFYGEDDAYRASPITVASEGGPLPATPDFDSEEERMLVSLSQYVDARSVDGAYQISDAAFAGQTWSLDLAQAPAVFEIQDGLYSVVAGFEGSLGGGDVPSNVNVEFFVARTANGYEVRDSWITSANGIPRTRLYQSPVYPDVSTWEAGRLCPFTGQQMVPMEAHPSEHG